MKTTKNNKCFLIVLTTKSTRRRFKRYCREKQGISMACGLNALMNAAAKKNFNIVSKTTTEVEM